MSGPETIASMVEFLVHAYALETESVDRYEELADAMEVHNNQDMAALFRQFADFGRQHAAEVERLAQGKTLPPLQPWEFKWLDAEGPETGDYGDTHYLMSPIHALQFALRNEQRGRDYYATVARGSPNPEVRALAQEFTEEESRHAAILERWISEATPASGDWAEDLDPPHAPE